MRTDRPARPGPGGRRKERGPARGGTSRQTTLPARGGSSGRGGWSGKPPRETEAIGLARGSDLLYGRNAVAEALRGRRQPRRLFVAEGVREDDRLGAVVARAEELGIPVERPPRPMLDDLARGANHQGIALEASGYPYAAFDDVLEAPGTVLVLDHLQDPQNFGTLLRAAEASGAAGIVIPQNRAVAVTPAVVNASAGAVEHLQVALVPNLARALDALKRDGRWIVGLESAPDAIDLYGAEIPTPVVLVVGSEGSGMGQNVRGRCDLLVALPMRGRVASLNAATAGAVALFELLRREAEAG